MSIRLESSSLYFGSTTNTAVQQMSSITIALFGQMHTADSKEMKIGFKKHLPKTLKICDTWHNLANPT